MLRASMTAEERPVIGITTRIELETDRFYLSRHYSEAVEAGGGVPLLIPLIPERDYLAHLISRVDGILLPGSDSDVDPVRYQREAHPQLGSVHPLKDETDLLALEEIEERRIPLFAICFGVQEGSLVAELAGVKETPVNSHHHQAIETLGRDLVATAWATDGLVEAVEDPRGDRFVLGVQWHPELGWQRDEFSRAMFSRFVTEARRFSQLRVLETAGAPG